MDAVFTLILLVLFALIILPICIFNLISDTYAIVSAIKKHKDNEKEGK